MIRACTSGAGRDYNDAVNTKLFDLTGRTALVTGGSKGLGLAMACGFAAAGADVVISSRHEAELRAAVAQIKTHGAGRVEHRVADLSRRDGAARLAAEAIQAVGRIDILVNNAGSNIPQPTDAIRDEDWDDILNLNLTSCMALSRALIPPMKERRWGRIIHISSIMGLASKEGRGAYSATKAALIGFARATALEVGPFNITVNCLAPGPFLTDLPGTMLTTEQKAAFADRTAVGRWGEPREMAGPALLLASEAGSYITGATLVVDGGTLCKTF
jgi:NAD(P)-dependent dehydrogenase (short-subunit alcohol dehydrogenase family)